MLTSCCALAPLRPRHVHVPRRGLGDFPARFPVRGVRARADPVLLLRGAHKTEKPFHAYWVKRACRLHALQRGSLAGLDVCVRVRSKHGGCSSSSARMNLDTIARREHVELSMLHSDSFIHPPRSTR